MSTPPDIETYIAAIAAGDQDSLATLYNATSEKLFGLTLWILGNRADAEDALVDTYRSIWQAAGKYPRNGLGPMTWLLTIARNTAVDRLRRRQIGPRGGREDLDDIAAITAPARSPEMQSGAAGARSQIANCLDKMPKDRAIALRRAYLDGQTYVDLADRLDVSADTLRAQMSSHLAALRGCLDAGDDQDHGADAVLTAEYALGLLTRAEAADLEARLTAEPALSQLLINWTEDLAQLTDPIGPVIPPAALFDQIGLQLFGPKVTRWWQHKAVIWLAGVGVAVGAALLIVNLLLGPSNAARNDLFATISAADRSVILDVAFDPDSGVLALDRTAGTASDDHVLTLWLVLEDLAPMPLGPLPTATSGRLTVDDQYRRLVPGAILAISEEPIGGSLAAGPPNPWRARGRIE
ncbi:sigma-70 family RNA polymerase sigma factor [Yoonia sp. SS1-5]|uniref:Sigma-70 family RNA polymerase sigma factor n=1 Tax=Yoonia rhodophyticola TaxID=3137370 RepID=A0AAN0NLL4_9RHOB